MKKLIILLSFLPLFSWGQSYGTNSDGFPVYFMRNGRAHYSAGNQYEPEAAALFARMPNNQTDAEKLLINTAIKTLVDSNIWGRLYGFGITALADSANAQLNWIDDDRNLTATTSITFTPDSGWNGHAADASYLTMDFNPSVDSNGLYRNTRASVGAYINTEPVEDHTFIFGNSGGGSPTSAATGVIYRTASWQMKVNEGTSGYSEFFHTGRNQGFVSAVRTDTTTEKIYFNGVLQNTETGLTAGAYLLNGTFHMLRNANTTLNRSDARVAAWYYGDTLSASEMTTLYNTVQTFLTAKSAHDTWSNDTMLVQGFEGTGYDNYAAAWTKSGTSFEDYATNPLSGLQSDSILSTAYIYTDFPKYSDTVSISWKMRIPDITPTSTSDIMYLQNINTPGTTLTTFLLLKLLTTGRFQVAMSAANNSVNVFSDATNYYCWLDYIKGTGADSQGRLYVSTNSTKPGTPECVVTTGNATLQPNRIRFIGTSNGAIIIDDVKIFVP